MKSTHPLILTVAPRGLRATSTAVLVIGLLLTRLALADLHIWDGSYSAYWSASENWQSGVVPTDGNDLLFPSGALRFTTTNNINGRRFRSLTIAASGYTLRGNSLTLSNGLSAQYATGASTLEFPIDLGAAQIFECTSSAAWVDVKGDLDLGSYDLTIQGAGEVGRGGIVSGSGGITKNGTGTLHLYGADPNTYSGVTRVNSERLR